MLIYLICFAITIFFTYLLERNRRGKNIKILEFVYILIIIGVTTLFAGFRDKTIGTDIQVYVEPILNGIYNYGFNFTYDTANVEILFVVLGQITCWLNGDINTFLIIIQLIMSTLVIKSILGKRDDKQSIVLYMLTYLCMFYGIGFNLMRQSIAMTIILFAYQYVKNQKIIKYSICVIIASLFHSTAIFMIVLYPMWKLLGTKNNIIIKFVLVVAIVGIVLFISPVLTMLVNIGILPEKFIRYVTVINNSQINIQFLMTGMKLLLLGICYLVSKYSKNKKEDSFAFFILIIDIILFQLGAIAPFIERISYYFSIIGYMELVPKALIIVKKDKFNIGAMYLGIVLLLLIYFYISFVYLGISSIVPYTSQILHIG